jgi:hypothetical protein
VSAMNRRDLLKFAAGAPLVKPLGFLSALDIAAPAVAAPAAMYQGRNRLDVFLHGMFAVHFVVDVQGIFAVILYPPHVDKGPPGTPGTPGTPHAYFASDLTGNPVHFLRLDPGGIYNPFNFQGATRLPQFSEFENVVVQVSDQPHSRKRNNKPAHCTMTLPMPHEVIPRKPVIPKDGGKSLFTKTDALLGTPTRIPLITVLRYDLGPSGTAQDNVSKYHYFAEPAVCPTSVHTSQALDELRKLYNGLDSSNLEFNTCLGLDDLQLLPEADLGEISKEDEHALVELLDPSVRCTDTGHCPSETQAAVQPKSNAVAPKPKPAVPPNSRGGVQPKPSDTPPSSGQLGIHPTACMSVLFVPS